LLVELVDLLAYGQVAPSEKAERIVMTSLNSSIGMRSLINQNCCLNGTCSHNSNSSDRFLLIIQSLGVLG